VKNSILFIKDFLSRSGGLIFSSSVISRVLSFFASWIAIQLIPNKELGSVIFSFQIIAFLFPIAGLGLNQGLLRYGAQVKTILERNNLFKYTLKYGVLTSIVLTFILIIISFFFNFDLENAQFYLILLSTGLTTNYIYSLVKIQFLLNLNNKIFSKIELTYNCILVVLVTLLSFYFKELGYAISLILTPIITSLLFLSKLNINWKNKYSSTITNFSFWRYGFFASLSNVTTQLLVSIDIILIGSLLENLELVTAFKYISLLPFSLLFISQAIITTDFVSFTKKIDDKTYIFNYIKNYIKLLTIISLACLVFIYFTGSTILSLFEKDYVQYSSSLNILTIGITGILILRGVFGNLLSSIGKAHINFVITTIALIINVILNYYLIPKYKLMGAALTSSILMWFTGVLTAVFFFYYYRRNEKT